MIITYLSCIARGSLFSMIIGILISTILFVNVSCIGLHDEKKKECISPDEG